MADRTVKVELTQEELQQEREAAAVRAAEKVLDDVPTDIEALAAVKIGLVTAQHLADIYDITPQTARNWMEEPVNPNSRPHLYRVEEIPDMLDER